MANGDMKKRLENFDLFKQSEVELKDGVSEEDITNWGNSKSTSFEEVEDTSPEKKTAEQEEMVVAEEKNCEQIRHEVGQMPMGIPQQYVLHKEEQPKKKKNANSKFAVLTFIIGVASLLLSVLSVFASIVAMYTIPVSIFGIINAKRGMKANGTKLLAVIGFICTIISLVVSAIVVGVTIYMLVKGMIG